MSFTPNMADSDGVFGPAKEVAGIECKHCKAKAVVEEEWDSSCGGWTDWKYTCRACGRVWWVEGIDS